MCIRDRTKATAAGGGAEPKPAPVMKPEGVHVDEATLQQAQQRSQSQVAAALAQFRAAQQQQQQGGEVKQEDAAIDPRA